MLNDENKDVHRNVVEPPIRSKDLRPRSGSTVNTALTFLVCAFASGPLVVRSVG